MREQGADPVAEPAENRARNGLIAAFFAYTMWGVLPVYFKAVAHVPAFEILAHRVIWAVPFGALIIAARGQWPEVRRAFRHRRTLMWLSLAAVFIAINWLMYVWAVQRAQIFQASLGYYINPLMYVLIGVLFLGERLRPYQVLAVAFAAIGVTVLTVSGGVFPYISITLAISFTTYGVIRKQTPVGGMPGLFVETVILLPLALAYLAYALQSGQARFGNESIALDGLLVLGGPVTVLPLLCFALAARRLNLSTLGFMQFIAPTLHFLAGLFYGEVLTLAHIVCFGCIWLAVALFSFDAWQSSRRRVPVATPG